MDMLSWWHRHSSHARIEIENKTEETKQKHFNSIIQQAKHNMKSKNLENLYLWMKL